MFALLGCVVAGVAGVREDNGNGGSNGGGGVCGVPCTKQLAIQSADLDYTIRPWLKTKCTRPQSSDPENHQLHR